MNRQNLFLVFASIAWSVMYRPFLFLCSAVSVTGGEPDPIPVGADPGDGG